MSSASRHEIGELMARAARDWLELLDVDQRAAAMGAVPADDASDLERRRWFYTPTDHGGLTLHRQRPAQQRAAMRLVAGGLSEAGYNTVATIMGMENVLDRAEGFAVRYDRERGRDPGLYYLQVFGEPGGRRPWGWRFGGHHVSLNNLVVDGQLVSTTPNFLGADPASSPLLGGAVNRPLARVEDIARELVRSLPDPLLSRALLTDKAPPDLITANRPTLTPGDRYLPLTGVWRDASFADEREWARLQTVSDAIDGAAGYAQADHLATEYTDEARGLPACELNAEQRRLLRAVLETFFARVPAAVSPSPRYAEDAALDAVHIAWAGSLEAGRPHYYRLQGPALLIEWDNGQAGANHAHSVWRDPSSDFGADALADHHRSTRH